MGYNPDIHHRRSIRLRGYDYSCNGAYFVTICVQGRECLLGEVGNREIQLNDSGRMVELWWQELSKKFPFVEIDSFKVMPNHFHGIIVINDPVGADLRVCPFDEGTCMGEGAHAGAPLQRVVQWFKTMTTNAYIKCVQQSDWPPFPGRLWQRNYYERIIRNDAELNAARTYIEENPAKWAEDDENPDKNP